jgi:hypothetical protein
LAASDRKADLPRLCESLEQVLRAQLQTHQRLLSCVERKRQAVRQADIGAIGMLAKQEAPLLSGIQDLERQRLQLAQQLTAALRPGQTVPLKAAEIAQSVGDSLGAPLLVVASELKQVIAQVQRETGIVRSAIDTLSKHMAGVVHTVSSALSRTQVYSRGGRMISGEQVQFAIDIKS